MSADLLHGFRLGDLLIEPARGLVSGPGGDAHMPPHATEVLLRLAREPGRVVSRDVLLAGIWGDGKGSQDALSHAVSELRSALRDDPHQPRYIQTVPREGYRLITDPVPFAGDDSKNRNRVSPGIFENLKQRGVIETALAYLVLGWLIIQVADVVFGQLLLPRWVGTFVTVLVIAGFPIALILSWFLEFRSGRATIDDGSLPARRRGFSRSYVSIVTALVAAALLVYGYDRYVGLPEEAEAPLVPADDEEASLLPVRANSIAVLPFFNIDEGDRTRIFAHGLAEDVINRLAMIPGLAVASRGDCWSLEPNTPSRDVRRRLRVAYYLEGSVRLEGDQLRVVVQLIDSLTGFHLVSRSFDRRLEDFAGVQRDVTELVVANLRVALPSETRSALDASYEDMDIDAYVQYRKGKDVLDQPRNPETLDRAIEFFRHALDIDPGYAAAYAGICSAEVARFDLSSDSEDLDLAEQACAAALNRNPHLYMVHTAIGGLHAINGRLDDAAISFEKALTISPTDADAMVGLAKVYARRQDLDKAEKLMQRAVEIQPGNWRTLNSLGAFYFSHGRYAAAANAFRRTVLLDPDNFIARQNEGAALILAGNFERGRRVLEETIEYQASSINYSNLGIIYYFLGNYAKSAEMHRAAVELTPGDPLRWVNLADTLYVGGHESEALEAFGAAARLAEARLAVDASDVDSLYIAAWCNQMLGDEGAATRLISRALELSPNNPYGHYYSALIQTRRGARADAMRAVTAALDDGYPPDLLKADPYFSEFHSAPEFPALFQGRGGAKD